LIDFIIYTAKTAYIQESGIYLNSETHGGEDVPIYANGPMSFLFEGTVEQSYIPHAMAYSACIGRYDTLICRRERGHVENQPQNSTSRLASLFQVNFIVVMLTFFFNTNTFDM
jgi:hypothetical protein